MYYENKIESLRDIFGTSNVTLEQSGVRIDDIVYPIVDDVIILCHSGNENFAEDIQFSFGKEWQKYNEVLSEHEKEFSQYFDIVDVDKLKKNRVCDLGCGNGRWSYFLADKCRELVLVDFSDAVFVARRNLKKASNCLFFKCDLKNLPFKNDFADFLTCLGVLHHLPTPCLDEVRNLKKYAETLHVFLYYALDNRPSYFRILLNAVTIVRNALCKIRSPIFRYLFTKAGAFFIYLPLIYLGRILRITGLSRYVPLYEFYNKKSIKRIEQDVYDRFFTRIEQRVSRNEIMQLKDTFSDVRISDSLPYWHFLCKR